MNVKRLLYRIVVPVAVIGLLFAGYTTVVPGQADSPAKSTSTTIDRDMLEKATFAGGCFWCMEPPFEKQEGVHEAVSGYMGGHVENPTYEQVSSGNSGHREVVQVLYNPEKVSYEQLLEIYWRQVDPTDDAGQFVDRGFQYTTAIFYWSDEQKQLARQSKEILESSGIFDKPIVTPIVKADTFYRAEDYHQDYYKTHSVRYKFYRYNSGRDDYLEETWAGHEKFEIFPDTDKSSGNTANYEVPDRKTLKEKLTPLQYRVTQHDGTEPAFNNKYWDNTRAGIYVDVVSGEPLFSSTHKYKSGTGWPSFYRPLEPDNIVTQPDNSLFVSRTEVRSRHADSHLGHVFEDGPEPTGLRYCINSAALEFIPADQLEERGYGEYKGLFESTNKSERTM